MKISIITTATNPEQRMDPFAEAMACYHDLADEVIVTGQDWPEEFEWDHIGKTFQEGYEQATGDWVIRMDLDYLFHHRDLMRIRKALENHANEPAMSFWKYQFLLVDRYQIKARPVIAMNKGMFDIKLNGGGDLCQPTLNGELLHPDKVTETKVPIYNYDFSFKTAELIRGDFGRFSRAWEKTFKNRELGGPDNESAFDYFKEMMVGRFSGRGHEKIALDEHPVYIQDRIKAMTPDLFGHSMFGWVGETAGYFV